jgi:hypothetical protein
MIVSSVGRFQVGFYPLLLKVVKLYGKLRDTLGKVGKYSRASRHHYLILMLRRV